MSGIKGYLAIVSGLALCPCHLPIYAAVFAGTALGTSITDNYGLLFPFMAVYFVGALFFGVRWMTRTHDPLACPTCEPAARSEEVGARSLERREIARGPGPV